MIIKRHDRLERKWLTEHFQAKEFFCKDGICRNQIISLAAVKKLEDMRKIAGPIIVSSGYRCEVWNKSQGGKPDSQHLKGSAFDIMVKGVRGLDLAKIAIQCGFRGIGVAEWWCHVDDRKDYALWTYDPIEVVNVKLQLQKEGLWKAK